MDTSDSKPDYKKEFAELRNRLDEIRQRNKAKPVSTDIQLQQLISWARKVAEKTGIPLENL